MDLCAEAWMAVPHSSKPVAQKRPRVKRDGGQCEARADWKKERKIWG